MAAKERSARSLASRCLATTRAAVAVPEGWPPETTLCSTTRQLAGAKEAEAEQKEEEETMKVSVFCCFVRGRGRKREREV